MSYNFVRIHKTLRVTPAMAAGVTDRLWSMEDVVELIEKNSKLRHYQNLENCYSRSLVCILLVTDSQWLVTSD